MRGDEPTDATARPDRESRAKPEVMGPCRSRTVLAALILVLELLYAGTAAAAPTCRSATLVSPSHAVPTAYATSHPAASESPRPLVLSDRAENAGVPQSPASPATCGAAVPSQTNANVHAPVQGIVAALAGGRIRPPEADRAPPFHPPRYV